jgi:antitoxin CptB
VDPYWLFRSPESEPPAREPEMIDERSWARLRWRCRRGMLENDIVLTRYLDAVAGEIGEQDLTALDRLLDMNDNELRELLTGRKVPDDEKLQCIVRQLRGA